MNSLYSCGLSYDDFRSYFLLIKVTILVYLIKNLIKHLIKGVVIFFFVMMCQLRANAVPITYYRRSELAIFERDACSASQFQLVCNTKIFSHTWFA